MVLTLLPNAIKPRFHDEECFGSSVDIKNAHASDYVGAKTLIESAQLNISKENVEAAVNDMVSAYEALKVEIAELEALRNETLRSLSASRGWQDAPHPQALKLRKLTPSIPLKSKI